MMPHEMDCFAAMRRRRDRLVMVALEELHFGARPDMRAHALDEPVVVLNGENLPLGLVLDLGLDLDRFAMIATVAPVTVLLALLGPLTVFHVTLFSGVATGPQGPVPIAGSYEYGQ